MDDQHPMRIAALFVVDEAARRHHVTISEVLGRGRSKSVAEARLWAMAECRVRFGWSYPEIGRVFSRDHTTVMHAVYKVYPHLKLGEAAE